MIITVVMKPNNFALFIQKLQIECLPCQLDNSSSRTSSICDNLSLPSFESKYNDSYYFKSSDLVIRSDITKIQERLFDILTIRIINGQNNFTQMYYNHQEVDNFVKLMRLNKLYQVSFQITNIDEFKELEQNMIFGELDPTARIFLPNNGSSTTIKPPYSTILVKAHFFDTEKHIQFMQKISKKFKILDESKLLLNHL